MSTERLSESVFAILNSPCNSDLCPRSISRRLAFFAIEQQLSDRGIPYKAVASTSSTTPFASSLDAQAENPPSGSRTLFDADPSTPYLVIRANDLLRGDAGKIAYPNIAIQCSEADETAVGFNAVMRVSQDVLLTPRSSSSLTSQFIPITAHRSHFTFDSAVRKMGHQPTRLYLSRSLIKLNCLRM